MSKNTKIVGGVLLVAIILVAVAYAAITNVELNINGVGNAQAKQENFKVEFIRSTHSIPDSVMLAIKTPVGTILHTGDFKVDYTPIDGKIMDLGRIAELGNEGILALMS